MKFRTLMLLIVVCWPRPAAAQLDPLLFIKRLPPNVLIAVDTANRMQRDTNNDYRDDNVYLKQGYSWEFGLGVNSGNTSTSYRRKFISLLNTDTGSGSDKFEADHVEIVGDLDPAYATYDLGTRINIAKLSLKEVINRNTSVARFGLLRMRQSSPRFVTPASSNTSKWDLNEGPVKIVGSGAQALLQKLDSPLGGGKFNITRPVVNAVNGAIAGPVGALVAAESSTANASVLSTLSLATGAANSLIPAGRDAKNYFDAPVDTMLDDLKAEAARLFALDGANCRNTVAILVVGGGRGDSSSGNLSTKASAFLNVTAGHRVPIYVMLVSTTATTDAERTELKGVATNSGGAFTEITPAMVTAAGVGKPVPEFVRAVNVAIQHTFAAQADFDTAPTASLPTGPYTEHQVTSPIIGTVNIVGLKDIDGVALVNADIKNPTTGVSIPQRSNLMVTSGFSLPGMDGKLRAFRVYHPEADSKAPSGYKFVQDGKRLWIGCAPGTTTAASSPCTALTTSQRNIYTALPDGSVVKFDAANATTLRPYLKASSDSEAAAIISFIRSQPLGAIIDSTPAIMDAPSLDPPPDADYPGFAADNKDRRSLVWVGANDGMLHAIDARLGQEVWAFVPFNLLPKLSTLQSGQPIGDPRFFVDGSPKIADVKIAGKWRTYLVMGEGPGGTFYQTFDVTLDDIANTVTPASDSISSVLSYFASASSVPLKWTFPRYSIFDVNAGVYGELGSSATNAEKSVGETWSDPAVGQIENASGKFVVLTGSGFLKHSVQQASRGGAEAGNTFYVLDVETGAVFDSRSVGSDGTAEAVDNCGGSSVTISGSTTLTANDCSKQKNALQADPIATGPPDSRFITKVYLGDLDGKIWRFDIGTVGSAPKIKSTLNLYTMNTGSGSASAHPIFSSMATVNVGGTQQYLFVGTGSDLLPSNGVSSQYALVVVLDNGTSGSKVAQIALDKTDGIGVDEKVTAFPAVAGDIVFFATTSYKPTVSCGPNIDGNLYAFTFIGGPAYDTTGDGQVSSGKTGAADSTKVRTEAGARASSPFIVDQHLVFGAGNKIEMFGDPQDFNNGVGQVGVRILSWREVR